MEKLVAHYNLKSIKTLIANGDYKITSSARQSYIALNLEDKEVLEIIMELRSNNLYKSMTSYYDNTIWQDVYHSKYKNLNLYIKLQINDNAIIISFKEK